MKAIDRLYQYIENRGVSPSSFEKEINLSNGYLSVQKKRKADLGSGIIKKISDYCQDLNMHWLITGNGSMILDEVGQPSNVKHKFELRVDSTLEQQRIPLYNIEAVAGLVPLFDNPNQAETGEYISLPKVPKCDGAIFVTGDSMAPLLKSGDIVAYRKIHDFSSDIFWGEMYLISVEVAGEEYISVKYIQKSEKGEAYIKLVSENKQHQPKDVHLDKIRAMALVKASVRINSMG